MAQSGEGERAGPSSPASGRPERRRRSAAAFSVGVAGAQRAVAASLFCYLAWFALLLTGTAAYEGERSVPRNWEGFVSESVLVVHSGCAACSRATRSEPQLPLAPVFAR